ncbi:hypothetical protein BD769DRAFT_1658194 [Suillus cothurnatus]|nr:hypothetical protein BD769DRAFT_1658194 [Suillus cothurnatus]
MHIAAMELAKFKIQQLRIQRLQENSDLEDLYERPDRAEVEMELKDSDSEDLYERPEKRPGQNPKKKKTIELNQTGKQFWVLGIPKWSGSGLTFLNLPELNFNFNFNYNNDGGHANIKISSSRFALSVNQATVSLFEDIYLLQSICFMDPPLAVNSNGSPWILLLWGVRVCSMHKTRCQQQNYCCALNPDGSLKDASEITFFNDPNNEPSSSTASTKDPFSILLKAGCTPATVAAGSRCSGCLQLWTHGSVLY